MYDHYQGLIFDMDGTLLDTESAHIRAWEQVIKKYHITFDIDYLRRFNGSPSWVIAEVLIKDHNIALDPYQLAAEKIATVETMLLDEVKILPLFDIVKSYFQRKPMAIGTGSVGSVTDLLVDGLGIRHYFDAIVTADDVKKYKPAPDTFLQCARLINVAPEKCLVFEDADFGIQAAKAAGMDVIDVRLL